MKLNLKPREVEILDKDGNPTGMRAIVRPLQTWASLEFQDMAQDGAFKVNKESIEMVRKILKAHVDSISDFTVDDHAGTVDEMIDNAGSLTHAINLLAVLMKISVLTEAEAGN